jgi:hypothetical protein
MLCKIWGFHGSDYKECRLLGYKTPVRTSQETHYFSTTESSRLKLCNIWGFHGCDYEEYRLLRYDTVWFLWDSEERTASIIRVNRINKVGTILAERNIWSRLQTLFLARWFFTAWWWRRYVPLKRRFWQELHGVITKKVAFFKFLPNLIQLPRLPLSSFLFLLCGIT